MFYHPQDNKITVAIKHLVFLVSLISMLLLLVFLINDETKIPQKEITLRIDMKNKVNICQPEEDFPKKSFFDF